MNNGCLTLFGLPFLGAGLLVLLISAEWWLEYRDAAQWERVAVTIEHSEVITSRSSDSTTYRNEVRYSYVYNGVTIHSERVAVESGGSSGSHHHQRHRELTRHLESGEPFLAWVNPKDPSQAILFREANSTLWFMPPFGMVFFTVGLGICAAGVMGKRTPRRRHGIPPWDNERLWPQQAARSAPWKAVVFSSGPTLLLGGFAALYAFLLLSEDDLPAGARWAGAGLALVPLIGIAISTYFVLRALRYGRTHLAFAQLPIAPGDTMRALLVSKAPIQAEQLDCTLICERRYWESRRTSKGSSRTRVVTNLCRITHSIPIDGQQRQSEHGYVIPISIDIPAGNPGRDVWTSRPVYWELTISAQTPGVDFKATYQLPIYERLSTEGNQATTDDAEGNNIE